MIRLKVTGISSLTDARYCAGMGVEFLSICFDEKGKGGMSPEAFSGIQPWIEGVNWIGEYPGNDSDTLRSLNTLYKIESWISPIEIAPSEIPPGLTIIRSVSSPASADDSVSAHLQLEGSQDFSSSGLQKIRELIQNKNTLFLGEPLPADEVIRIYQEIPELIFSLRSSQEERPGWMDLGTLQDYMEALEDFLSQ